MKPAVWPLVAPERLPTANQLHSGAGTLFAIADDGELSLGVLCMGPGCVERNTARSRLRRIPLCPSCRAALEGHAYSGRHLPPRHAPLGATPPDLPH